MMTAAEEDQRAAAMIGARMSAAEVVACALAVACIAALVADALLY